MISCCCFALTDPPVLFFCFAELPVATTDNRPVSAAEAERSLTLVTVTDSPDPLLEVVVECTGEQGVAVARAWHIGLTWLLGL